MFILGHCSALLLLAYAVINANALAPFRPTVATRALKPLQQSTTETAEPSKLGKTLTQKEYLIAVRNRLFAVEEQIWLHEYAVSREDPKVAPLSQAKYDKLLRVRGDLLEEYPSTKLHTDLYEAQTKNLTYAAMYLDRLINNFDRQMPLPMNHINQIAVVSFSGQIINLMRGQGAVYHRLLPSNVVIDESLKRQFQHPAFSRSGKYVAFAEMHFKDGAGFVKSDALVFEVPTDAKEYGTRDSMPLFDSGELPGAPFFLRFSPDEESLVMLCSSSNPKEDPHTAIVLIDWGKYYRKDSWAGQAAVARFAPRKALTLMQGNPVYFTYTTSNPKNATIVAHCHKDVEVQVDDPSSPTGTKTETMNEKAVWLLQRQDTGGVRDYNWVKVADSSAEHRWSTPICHSAGGGDNVLVVEDGWLTTKALSRWKRDKTGKLTSKRLREVRGQVQFLVSPDSSRLVLVEEDIHNGYYSLTAIEGEDALNPSSTSMGNQYEIDRIPITVAFWFSPDSTKLLCLTAKGKTKQDIESQRSDFKVGLDSDMTFFVYNFPLQEVREYDTFQPTPYFMKTYVPFFSQYAQVYNPWAPDSRSFIFMTTPALCHTPLVGSKHCLGVDKWQNQGATFGTWSRQ